MINRIKKFLVVHQLLNHRMMGFKSGDFYYYNKTRVTFNRALEFVQTPGRALDIGAGFGNETKILLQRGFEVVATDVNPEAVSYLKKLARRNHKLTAIQQALPEMPPGEFDLISCEMVLHFLVEKDLYNAIASMQNSTRTGGLNVISAYVDSDSIKDDPRMDGYCQFLLPSGTLQSLYKDWEILYEAEKVNAMGHPSIRLIARNVNKK